MLLVEIVELKDLNETSSVFIGATKTEEKKLEDVLNTKKAADTAAVTTEKKDDKAKDAGKETFT